MNGKFENIPIDKIKIIDSGVRAQSITNGLDELKENIKSLGLMQPITVYFDTEKKVYVIIAGQRRFNTYIVLNEENPNEGYDTIGAMVIDEPATEDLKKALSLTENLTQVQMQNTDVVRAVTDLYNTYRDYDIVQKKFGLTRYMISKYVRLARLPERLVQAINEGEISPNTKSAENAAIRAVDALNWQKGGDMDIEDVLKFAKSIAKGDIRINILEEEAKEGGTVAEIIDRASKKSVRELSKLKLSSEVYNKIEEIAKSMNMDPAKLLMDAINDILSKYQKDNS
jgi:ParB/RepB/Spo0J family partition protein